jgi:hypothetical protein
LVRQTPLSPLGATAIGRSKSGSSLPGAKPAAGSDLQMIANPKQPMTPKFLAARELIASLPIYRATAGWSL